MKFIVWSAQFDGPHFTQIEGSDLRSALKASNVCKLWEGDEPEPMLEHEVVIPGAFILGDAAIFDVESAEAMIALGRGIVNYLKDCEGEVILV